MRRIQKPSEDAKLPPSPEVPEAAADLSAAVFPKRSLSARGGKSIGRAARAAALPVHDRGEDGAGIQSVPERDAPAEVRRHARAETKRQHSLPRGSEGAFEIGQYVRFLWSVPWNTYTGFNPRLRAVREHLDSTILGFDKAKAFLLENLAVNRRTPDRVIPALCLVGPPGNGKNSLAEELAEALGRPHKRFSISGMAVKEELLGVDRFSMRGARAGKILSKICDAGCLDPVLVINGVDALAAPDRADLLEGMLAVVDPKRRARFFDRYLGLEVDLSKMIVILTANTVEAIPEALQRYAEVIEVPGHSEEEKAVLAHELILPRLRHEHGLKDSDLQISLDGLVKIIRDYTLEAGVNSLTRTLETLCRKRASDLVRNTAPKEKRAGLLSIENIRSMLGPEIYAREPLEDEPQVGLVHGLAWTQAGGEMLSIEAEVFAGTGGQGGVRSTGQLGEVMRESTAIAHSVVRSRCEQFGIDEESFVQMEFHLHFPMGGVPKDGPSAGAGIAVALASAMSDRPVRNDVAITGEVSLRGKILLVGGLREKALAAYRQGAKAMIYPRANEKDVESIPADVQAQLALIPVETIDEVFAIMISNIVKPKIVGGNFVAELDQREGGG